MNHFGRPRIKVKDWDAVANGYKTGIRAQLVTNGQKVWSETKLGYNREVYFIECKECKQKAIVASKTAIYCADCKPGPGKTAFFGPDPLAELGDYISNLKSPIYTNTANQWYIKYGKNKQRRYITRINCKTCNEKTVTNAMYFKGYEIDSCAICTNIKERNKVNYTKNKYINKHINRHVPYNKMLNEIGSCLKQASSGAILTLPGSSPHADTLRLLKYYNNTSRLIWYENDKTRVPKLRKDKKDYETIMGKELDISLHTTNILKSSHSNVALANIDLECTMNLAVMKDCLNIIHHGLKGRMTMGLILNTYGRGPKGMTLEQRDLLWTDFLEHTKCDIKYNSGRQGYNCRESGPGGTMFLFGAVLSKRTQVVPTPKINKQIPF